MADPALRANRFRFKFSFGLKTLLMVMLLSAGVFAWIGNSAYQAKLELSALKRLVHDDADPIQVIRNGELETVLTS